VIPHYDVSTSLDTDYYTIFEDLTAGEREVWARTREFVDTDVLPVINDYWERAEHPADLVKKLAALDVTGDGIDYPGMPQMSRTASGLVAMELSRGDGSIQTIHGVQSALVMRSIGWLGSPEQKARWLPALARWDVLGGFALTEPLHGSDSVSLETTARREGDAYVLDGAKRWIGNGSIADVLIVWARGDDGKVGGYLVERGTPGLQADTIVGKGSLRAIWQADIVLDGVRVPLDAKLPGCDSFRDTSHVLSSTRAGVAWAALGHALAAYEAALSYAKQRTQFGRPLASFQIVQDRLVKMLAEVTSMQMHCLRVARLEEEGRLTDTMASLAKMHNTRKARQVIADARDLLGGNGILLENHVMRHLADIEALHTYEGTETMQTLIVGRHITGIGAFA
jgi:glutaryl-CoA dehydrogenase